MAIYLGTTLLAGGDQAAIRNNAGTPELVSGITATEIRTLIGTGNTAIASDVTAESLTTTSGRYYGIQLDSAGQAVVNVPWTDTTTSLATASAPGTIELFSDTDQTVAANAVSTTANRTYGIQLNSDNQAVVNVPWTDTQLTSSNILSILNGATGSIDADLLTAAANISDVGVFDSTSARNASTANVWHVGDIAVITADPVTSYIYVGTDQTMAATTQDSDWQLLQTPDSTLTNAQILAGLNGNDGTTDINSNLLPAATSTAAGAIELFSDTAQTVAANAVSTTASRTYGLQVNGNGQGVVNVPWTDTTYTLPEATATVRGGIELFSNTDQSVAANAVSSTASRTYGLQLNSAGQGVVNVPWTDTTPNDTTITLSGGNGIVTTIGDFTTNQSAAETLTITHADTSSQDSVNNSGRTVIQDVTLDEFGHVTALASATLADNNTFRTVTAGGNTLGATETLAFTAGSNITISEDAGAVTIAATNTNTQLSEEQVEDFAGGMFTGNTETGIVATYQDDDGTIDLEVQGVAKRNTADSGFGTTTVQFWSGTQAQYDAIATKGGNTIYYVTDA